MVPTLKHGDVLLVRWNAPVRPGDLVVARFEDLPDHLVVKRAHHSEADRWDVRSDNEFSHGDSRQHGPAEVLARVVLVWPAGARGLRRVLPKAIR
jgi:phage repressor protein C with HTH and peptisase S24 domain